VLSPQAVDHRRFNDIADSLALPKTCTAGGTQMHSNYKTFVLPREAEVHALLDTTYRRVGLYRASGERHPTGGSSTADDAAAGGGGGRGSGGGGGGVSSPSVAAAVAAKVAAAAAAEEPPEWRAAIRTFSPPLRAGVRGCEVAATARPGRAGDEEADSNVRDWEEHSETTAAVIAARILVNDIEEAERQQPELEDAIANRAVYVDVRNHLIRMWYRNVATRLGVVHALSDVPAKYHPVGVLLFSYLERHGVINAGALSLIHCPVAERVRAHLDAPESRPPARRRPRRRRVAVVGAGMAGLATARQLVSFGAGVTVFEARGRLGGRIHTDEETFGGVPVDLGAMLITGIAQNPLAVVASQVGATSVVVQPACPLYDIDGKAVEKDADGAAEAEFNAILEEVDAGRRAEGGSLSNASLGDVVRKTWEAREKQRLVRSARERQVRPGVGLAAKEATGAPGSGGVTAAAVAGAATAVTAAAAAAAAATAAGAANGDGGAPGHTGATANGHGASTVAPAPPAAPNGTPRADGDGGATAVAAALANGLNTNPLMVRLLRWHQANLEYGCAASVYDVSAVHWDQDDPYGFEGDHVLLRKGFRPILDGMTAGLEGVIHTSRAVTKIAWRSSARDGPAVVITTVDRVAARASKAAAAAAAAAAVAARGTPREATAAVSAAAAAAAAAMPPTLATEFDAVVITAPLGVLKAGDIAFSPPLPPKKQAAIRRLGCGGLMKVALSFPTVFWDQDDLFGMLPDDDDRRGEFYIWWNMAAVLDAPVLLAIVAEPSVGAMEAHPDAHILASAVAVLRRRFPACPDPTAATVTRWTADPWARGAYTHIPVGSSGADYDVLAEPVGRRLFFAGEHTCRTNPTTCASAYMSGLREAARVVDALGMKEMVTDAHAAQVAAHWGKGEPAGTGGAAAGVPTSAPEGGWAAAPAKGGVGPAEARARTSPAAAVPLPPLLAAPGPPPPPPPSVLAAAGGGGGDGVPGGGVVGFGLVAPTSAMAAPVVTPPGAAPLAAAPVPPPPPPPAGVLDATNVLGGAQGVVAPPTAASIDRVPSTLAAAVVSHGAPMPLVVPGAATGRPSNGLASATTGEAGATGEPEAKRPRLGGGGASSGATCSQPPPPGGLPGVAGVGGGDPERPGSG